jgi:hypothetical protein
MSLPYCISPDYHDPFCYVYHRIILIRSAMYITGLLRSVVCCITLGYLPIELVYINLNQCFDSGSCLSA